MPYSTPTPVAQEVLVCLQKFNCHTILLLDLGLREVTIPCSYCPCSKLRVPGILKSCLVLIHDMYHTIGQLSLASSKVVPCLSPINEEVAYLYVFITRSGQALVAVTATLEVLSRHESSSFFPQAQLCQHVLPEQKKQQVPVHGNQLTPQPWMEFN